MTLRFTLTILIACIFTVNQTSAQDSSFQLKDYKFRTPGVRGLELDINLSGGVLDSKVVNSNDIHYRSFNSNPSLDYFKIISTDKRQHTSNFSLSPSYSSKFNSTDLTGTKTRAANLFGSWRRMDRFFFKKNTFFEIGNEFNTYGNSNRQFGGSIFSNSGRINFQDQLSAGVGKGRLENVQDAQMAMFIVNDLKKMNLLDQDISPEKMNELAMLITGINNRRVFDSRRRRIYELTKVDSFFQANNFVKHSSIAYFTAVNDNWAFAFNPGRQAGTIYYFRVRPSVRWEHSKIEQNNPSSTYKGSDRSFTYGYEPVIGIEKQKPVNLFWQKSMGASLVFVQEWRRFKSEVQNGNNPPQQPFLNDTTRSELFVNAFYAVGYYPSNRTMINVEFNIQTEYMFSNFFDQSQGFAIRPGIIVSASYFVSFRTRLSLYAGASWRYYDPGKVSPTPYVYYSRSALNANINIGFSHILF